MSTGKRLRENADEPRIQAFATSRLREDMPSPELLCQHKHLALSPDGQTLVVARGEEFTLFDVLTQYVRSKASKKHGSKREGRICKVLWCPSGKRFAIQRKCTVDVCGGATGEYQWEASGHSGPWSPLIRAAWSPLGDTLASWGCDEKVQLWNAKTGERTRVIKFGDRVPKLWFSNFAWAPSGRTFAVASDRLIQLWSSVSGELQHDFKENWRNVKGLEWSPKGDVLACLTRSRSILLLDIKSWTLLKVLILSRYDSEITRMAWSPCGSMLAYNYDNHHTKVWDIESKAIKIIERSYIKTIEHSYFVSDTDGDALSWHPTRRVLLLRTREHGSLWTEMLDVDTGLKLASMCHDDSVISPCGDIMIAYPRNESIEVLLLM